MNAYAPTEDTTELRALITGSNRSFDRMVAAETAKLRSYARVSMTGRRRFTRAEMKDGHRSALRSRRRNQLARTAGFDPTPNVTINNAFNAAYMGFLQQGLRPVEAHNSAWRQIARSLPLGHRVKRFGLSGSKQETVEGYIKPNVLKALRAA